MQAVRDWVRREPGTALLLLALAFTVALYAPTLGRGLVSYDDPWLVRDNFLLHEPSLRTIFLDTSAETRFTLGAEYLPIRDLSIVLDLELWGDNYAGFHLTNLVVYLGAIALWFAALRALGLSQAICGLAILIWALHPAHAESVAWISERKGLLGVAFSGAAVLGYARFRTGGPVRWLALACLATVCAVWSKAPAAFAVAVVAPLELVVPSARYGWRRVLVGLCAIAVVGALAFLPVVITAIHMKVVGTPTAAPAGWLAMVLGLHGFYLELSAMVTRNAVSYPISTTGPMALQIAVGAIGLGLLVTALAMPRLPAPIRIGAVVWLFGWFPASRIALPLNALLVADRYVLFPTLGIAILIATGLLALRASPARTGLVAAVLLASSLRTLDAQSNWRDSITLWQRATISSPVDGNAWSMYIESLDEAGKRDLVFQVLAEGLRHSHSPRLLLRKALLAVEFGQPSVAMRAMREAAEAGEVRAMANLAIMLSRAGRDDEALEWARKATVSAPLYAKGFKTRGDLAVALGKPEEALAAYDRARALAPADAATRFGRAQALISLGRSSEARAELEMCLGDPVIGLRARARLDSLQ